MVSGPSGVCVHRYLVVLITGLLLRESPSKLAIAGGKSFWSLVPSLCR